MEMETSTHLKADLSGWDNSKGNTTCLRSSLENWNNKVETAGRHVRLRVG